MTVIHTLRLRMSNVHLVVGKSGTVLIDTGSPGEAGRILDWIRGLGLPAPGTIFLTHGHADHAGSAAELRRRTGARLCLAPGDWKMVAAGESGPLGPVRLSAVLLQHLVPARFEPFEPDIPLDGSVTMGDLGLDATLLATPGHTAGSVSLIFRDGQAVIGDVLMGGHMGGLLRPHQPRAHYFVQDAAENRKSLSRLLSHGATRLHVGHGGPLRAETLQDWTLP
jgi:glyoxylase-like metal-dependent hydrolase (beta-lactamase superfamily II)